MGKTQNHSQPQGGGGRGQVAEGPEGPLRGDGNVLYHNCAGSHVAAY